MDVCGCLCSAGTFVTSFVVGAVALFVAPFPVEAAPFIRDAAMYAIAVVLVLVLYCGREVHIWHVSPHPSLPNPFLSPGVSLLET